MLKFPLIIFLGNSSGDDDCPPPLLFNPPRLHHLSAEGKAGEYYCMLRDRRALRMTETLPVPSPVPSLILVDSWPTAVWAI